MYSHSVGVDVFNVAGKWHAPKFVARAPPLLEDRGLADCYFCCSSVVNIYFLAVVDADVPGVGELARAEEQGAVEGWDHVDCACSVPDGVLEKADVGCR